MKMPYRADSEWNDVNEIRCLNIFIKLKEAGYPPKMQMGLCWAMSILTNLDAGNISAKVSNYKSVAGINKKSNASASTIDFYRRYGQHSSLELDEVIKKISSNELA